MNKPRTIEGCWWIHGDDKPTHFGVLTFDPDKGLKLSVKVPQERTTDEAFWNAIERSRQPGSAVPSVIHGANEHNNPVTLFGCYCLGPSASAGLDNPKTTSTRQPPSRFGKAAGAASTARLPFG